MKKLLLLISILLFPVIAWALPVLDQTNDGTASSASSKSISLTVTSSQSNLYIVAWVANVDTLGTVTSVKYNNVSLTKEYTVKTNNTTGRSMQYWDLVAPSTGANNLVVSWTPSNSGNANIIIADFYNVNQTTPIASESSSFGSSNNPALTFSSSASYYPMSGVTYNNIDSDTTPDTNWTLWYNIGGGAGGSAGNATGYYTTGGSSSLTRSDTLNGSTTWAVIGVNLQSPIVSSNPELYVGGGINVQGGFKAQ